MNKLCFYSSSIIAKLEQIIVEKRGFYNLSQSEHPIQLILHQQGYSASWPGWRVEVKEENPVINQLIFEIYVQLAAQGILKEPEGIELFPNEKILVYGNGWILTLNSKIVEKTPTVGWTFTKNTNSTLIRQEPTYGWERKFMG